MYRRYPAEHTQYHGDDQHEDEDDIADADHLSRITHAQMKIKQEETEDKLPAVNPFYLGKSSARALLTQVVKIKNQSRSGLSPMASTPRDEETDTDRSALRRPGPYPERAVDYPSPNSDADMSEDATSTGEHDVIRSEHEFLGRLRPQYWQILPVRPPLALHWIVTEKRALVGEKCVSYTVDTEGSVYAVRLSRAVVVQGTGRQLLQVYEHRAAPSA